MVRFVPKALAADAPEFSAVEAVSAAAFGQRRKMIRSSLGDYADAVAALGLDPTGRAETLSPVDFIQLAKY